LTFDHLNRQCQCKRRCCHGLYVYRLLWWYCDSSSRFRLRARTNRQTNKQTNKQTRLNALLTPAAIQLVG